VTGLYFWLNAPLVAAAFTYLVILVLLSLVGNLSRSYDRFWRPFIRKRNLVVDIENEKAAQRLRRHLPSTVADFADHFL
jgi:hypothetical protein